MSESETMKIERLAMEEGEVRAEAVFGAEYVGFQGHFPGGAVLPGFLHVELAAEVLGRSGRVTGELREVVAAKFSGPILPGERVRVEAREVAEGKWECELVGEKGVYSRMTLVFGAG